MFGPNKDITDNFLHSAPEFHGKEYNKKNKKLVTRKFYELNSSNYAIVITLRSLIGL